MKSTVFRQYDIRGKVGSELVLSEVGRLTHAIIYYLRQQQPINHVVVGRDGRLHSPAIHDAMCDALVQMGITVTSIGVCPSPVLYFYLHTNNVDAGLMITASHNPAEYNGIKIMCGTHSIWGDGIAEIAKLYDQNVQCKATDIPGAIYGKDGVTPYIDYMVDAFKDLHGATLSAVVDCGNATGGVILPELVRRMNWNNIDLLYAEVDGRYPHHEADPTVPENMKDAQHLLFAHKYEVAFGLDGDCDRMAAMTKDGTLVPGDQVLALFAQEIVQKHPRAGIVFDVKSSSGLIELLEAWGANPHMSPCGHAIVKEQMVEHKALLGGELSGHYCFGDTYFGFDDGIYALMRMVRLLQVTQQSLQELLKIFPHKFSSPEFRIFCADERKHDVMQYIIKQYDCKPNISVSKVDGVRVTESHGWWIVRPSNTQPALSIRCEADSAEQLTKIKREIAHVLSGYIDTSELAH